MAEYIRPRCDCGALLVFWEEEMYDITTPIANDGLLSERGIKRCRTGVDGAFSRLHCPECHNEYDFTQDIEGGYIRGEVWGSKR